MYAERLCGPSWVVRLLLAPSRWVFSVDIITKGFPAPGLGIDCEIFLFQPAFLIDDDMKAILWAHIEIIQQSGIFSSTGGEIGLNSCFVDFKTSIYVNY